MAQLDTSRTEADVAAIAPRLAPTIAWQDVRESEHFVQFYDHDDFLLDSVNGYIASALTMGAAGVVIATQPHLDQLERRLQALEIDVAAARKRGQYVPLEAAGVLSEFMIGESPDRQLFEEIVGRVIADARSRHTRVAAFGEMVALLWQQGKHDAAIELEKLWNDLAKSHSFSLFCAYPMSGFDAEAHATPFVGVCTEHSRVIPSETYAAHASPDERLRVICQLQQRAAALEREVRERRAAEQALLRSERELANFLDTALEGLHKVGPDGTILWANSAELKLLGYAAEEYIGRNIAEFHADADVIEDILRRLLAGDDLYDEPARLRCKDGSIKHVLIHSHALWEDEVFVYTRCFTHDVTTRVHLEQELEQRLEQLAEADRRKDEFLAMLGHELRNPLAPIRNTIEVLRRRESADETDRQSYAVLARQTEQMARLLDDLLDVARITQGRLQLHQQPLELMTVVARAIETARPVIEDRQHRLKVSLPQQPVRLYGDMTRLVQMVANLLNNAAKYTPDGGEIVVTAEHDDDLVTLRVQDNGTGIPADVLPRVFDLFEQGERPLERSEGGLGIGLTLVRRIAELHGGRVEAFSDGPGRGSEFVLHLPMNDGAQLAGVESNGAAPAPAAFKKRILVVDDNRDAVESMAALLVLSGHEAATALDGPSAIEAAQLLQPEVILLDIGLPGMDGYEVARRLRALDHSACLIALTGYGQVEDRRRTQRAGFDHHLVKPVDPGILERLLQG